MIIPHSTLPLQKRKGRITRNDMRRIIATFELKVSEENLVELLNYLDPQHTGFIKYHA